MATDKLGAADTRTPEEIEIHRLKAELNMLWHAGIIESLATDVMRQGSALVAAETQVSDLSARLARAVEVMRPFTCVVDLPDGHVQWTPPSLPAFQAARAFLSEQENRDACA